MTTIGQHIQELRDQTGSAIDEVATFLNMNLSSLQQIEQGRRYATKDQIIKLGQLLWHLFRPASNGLGSAGIVVITGPAAAFKYRLSPPSSGYAKRGIKSNPKEINSYTMLLTMNSSTLMN